MGEAIAYLERVGVEELPATARVSWDGASREFNESSSSLYVTFGLALLIVFLVLAAQFESFIHPLVIMLTVPLAVTGALGSILLLGLSLNIYSQIGMVMLIGLTAKNGILIVEFANQMRDEGRELREAIREASIVRLRPILMTSIATAFSAVPLATGSGRGSGSETGARHGDHRWRQLLDPAEPLRHPRALSAARPLHAALRPHRAPAVVARKCAPQRGRPGGGVGLSLGVSTHTAFLLGLMETGVRPAFV